MSPQIHSLAIAAICTTLMSASALAQTAGNAANKNRAIAAKDKCISTKTELDVKPEFKKALKDTNPFVIWKAEFEVPDAATNGTKKIPISITPKEDGSADVKIAANPARSVPFNLCLDGAKGTVYVSVFNHVLQFADDKFDRLKGIDPGSKKEIFITKGMQ